MVPPPRFGDQFANISYVRLLRLGQTTLVAANTNGRCKSASDEVPRRNFADKRMKSICNNAGGGVGAGPRPRGTFPSRIAQLVKAEPRVKRQVKSAAA